MFRRKDARACRTAGVRENRGCRRAQRSQKRWMDGDDLGVSVNVRAMPFLADSEAVARLT
jgi:hypothetical protein